MPRVVDSDLSDIDVADDVTEVAPIGESLGSVPAIEDLESILDPYAPAPTHSTTEQEGHQNGTH